METQAAFEYLRGVAKEWPATAVVLGSAQSAFADVVEKARRIPFGEIPGWPAPSVQGHAGELIVGEVGGAPVTVVAGRVHLYEGRTPQEAVFGVRVLARLGLKNLVLTNAAGGINPAYRRGMMVLITDHINLQGLNPLVGENDEALGPRFPDMSHAYDPELRALAAETAASLGIETGEGVYAGLLGPSFETPAEIRYLRTIGADLAGMSTVAECIAANHAGLRVLGISTVTNMAAGMQAELSHIEVLEIGRAASGGLARLLTALLPKLEG
jgi:purine-nucleoside phosphorylase